MTFDDATVSRASLDATIARPKVEDDATVSYAPTAPDDATVMTRGSRNGIPGRQSRGSVAMPVDDTELSVDRRSGSLPPVGAVPGRGLDPDRRIAPVPGAAPWESEPVGERGVRVGAQVVYPARSKYAGQAGFGTDEVQRALGPAPAERPVAVRAGRDALPSTVRRSARVRRGTLLALAGAVVLSVLGLVGVAAVAFG